jgi:hypothetical protein
MTEAKRRNPVVTGWLVAIAGLVIAFLLGWGLMTIGAGKLEAARKTRQPLQYAVSFIATEAIGATQEAAAAVAASNWGEAQQRLGRVNEIVTALERAKSDENGSRIDRVRRSLGEAQAAVGQQKSEARDRVEQLISDLEALQVK